jgi:hypothetical protein
MVELNGIPLDIQVIVIQHRDIPNRITSHQDKRLFYVQEVRLLILT